MDNKEIALLVEKAKENDKSAMGKLYNETHKKAYFVALKMTKNEDDAMDILQDSFVKAFKKIDTLENPEQFQSWLNQIVANKCRDYLKKKKEIFFSETEDEDGNSIEDTFEEENISLIPDKSLDTAETKRLVMNIIEGLSEDQKLCVLMYYYENMSVGDIAEALECSTGTVKSRLNYARQKIKTEVENLEKTQGIKLYGIAPVPFVVWVLMRMSESTVVPRDIAPLVIESAVGTAGAATVAGGTAGAAAGVGAGAT
ncbi:MAG: RNA polymerase sigma factor, partial [Oscillospiraceae bacterium]|nr:RNA polymerase sigma factor [Oscillospiraceae bacterium]